MKNKIALVLLALASILSFSFASAVSVSAEEDSSTSSSSSVYDNGYLMITPPWIKYGLLEPGSNYTQSFTAYNIGNEELSFNLTVEPFSVADLTYDPIFSQATNSTKITDWVSFPDGTEFTLDPQENVEIRVRVKIPKDAVGGGQYAAVMANIETPEDKKSGTFAAQSRIALQLYSTVNGDVEYKGDVIDQKIQAFSFDSIIKTTATLENTGNADFEATYKMTVKSFFGDKEPLHEDTKTSIILPGTKRVSEQNWDDAPALGLFRVEQEISYINPEGEQAVGTYSRVVIICPIWLFIVIALMIVLIIMSLIISSKKRKSGKKSKKPSWEQK